MSAPPRDAPLTMPTMVSRLPKFGSRPKSSALSNGAQTGPTAAASTRLTNGFYHHPGPAGVNGGPTAPAASVKQNGFIRVPTSFKWRRESETVEDGGADGEREWTRGKGGSRPGNGLQQYSYQRQSGSPVAPQRDAKKTTTSAAGKGRSFGLPVPSPPSRTLPVPKSGSHASKPGQTAPALVNGAKQTLSGRSGSKLRSGTGGSGSGPGSRSGSPLQKKPPASRSHSSDSLGPAAPVPLSESDRLRSRSLTQVRRQPSPTLTLSSTSAARSHSIIRAAGRGASSAQAPPRAAPGRSGVPSLLPPSALKKPLLSGLGPAPKTSGISYKLSRPSLIKQTRPLRVTNEPAGGQEVTRGPTARRNSVETPSTAENSPESSPEAPEAEGGPPAEPASQGEASMVGETLEDMSLSSSSSLDRNDTSQEYMDDFDNLGNGGVGFLLLHSKNEEDDSGLDRSCPGYDKDKAAGGGVSKAAGLCFLDDGVDWAGVALTGGRAEQRPPHRSRSGQPEDHEQGGSSLDLSPSDSCGSGGTYMWDEEGLEPLGGASTATASVHTNGNTTHHIGSFDSDVNSIDLLNNLDSCDLDDDDLMLDDAELPEDASLHSDGDGVAHMAQWRMRQLCWGTQDVHNDNDRSPCLSPGPPGLGLDVEELAEDCCAVRSQLEHLQRFLQQEEEVDEDTLTTDTLSPDTHSSHSCDAQALMQEVQQLREELRSRDRTIAQLSLQLTVPTATARCRCQETTARTDRHTQTSAAERESVASQTPWRELAAFAPVPFLSPPWQYQRSRPFRARPKPSIPSHLARKITDISPLRPGASDAPEPAYTATAHSPAHSPAHSSAHSPALLHPPPPPR